MRGSSRASLAEAAERVEPLLASEDDVAALGEQLFGVAGLLDSSAGLRRALTDPSRDGQEKADLVTRLLSGQVGDAAQDVVAGLARSRWAAGRDLADACELLGTTAVLAAAQQAGRLETVEEELFRFGRAVAGDADLMRALTDRGASVQRRTQLVEALLAERAAPETLTLARQAVAHPRGRTLQDALAEFGEVAAQRRERLVALVTAAAPLREEQRERLAAALGRIYGRTLHLNVDVDPEVVGGIRVQVGDEVIDGTVVGRLETARQGLGG